MGEEEETASETEEGHMPCSVGQTMRIIKGKRRLAKVSSRIGI
jgi:hypothetical protein